MPKVPDYSLRDTVKSPVIPKPRTAPKSTPTPERKQSGGSSMLDLQPKMTPKPTPEPKKRTITPQPTKPEML